MKPLYLSLSLSIPTSQALVYGILQEPAITTVKPSSRRRAVLLYLHLRYLYSVNIALFPLKSSPLPLWTIKHLLLLDVDVVQFTEAQLQYKIYLVR